MKKLILSGFVFCAVLCSCGGDGQYVSQQDYAEKEALQKQLVIMKEEVGNKKALLQKLTEECNEINALLAD